MNDEPRQKLRELIVEYGRSLCNDPNRCEALLKDYCGVHKREIFVLVSALKKRVTDDMLMSSAGVPQEIVIARVCKRLEDELAMTSEAAHWAVESWALALGVVEQPEPNAEGLQIVKPIAKNADDVPRSPSLGVRNQRFAGMAAPQSTHERRELISVQAELSALQHKCGELAAAYLRGKADAENARRRAEDEISKSRKFAIESFAESLLVVADSLEAVLVNSNANGGQIRAAEQAALRQLMDVFEHNRVFGIDPAPGSKFDTYQQMAICLVPSEQAPSTVVGVLQKGYRIADRVLRPAQVTVADFK